MAWRFIKPHSPKLAADKREGMGLRTEVRGGQMARKFIKPHSPKLAADKREGMGLRTEVRHM